MMLLLAGLVLFLGAHSVRIVADDWRTRTIVRLGTARWRGLYSLVAVAGLLMIIEGYGLARGAGIVVYDAPSWTRAVATLLMLPTLVLLAAAYVPGTRIAAAVGHPMVLAALVWAAGHLLANGRLADVLLFGAFLLWTGCDFSASRRRDRASGVIRAAGPWWRDGAAIMAGAALWGAILLGLHRWLGGVPLLAA